MSTPDDALSKRVSQTAATVITAAEPAGAAAQTSITPAPIAHSIGDYTIRRIIGSGGMGVVYEAEQQNPKRIVALKVMREGIASPALQRRFEYEAQLLARLRHPGIAQIYEAGTHTPPPLPGVTPAPIPYYAMEFVPDAMPLTTFATSRRLSVRERLELFAKVCDAVHHGHTKGVIHRDLKPANILVDISTGVGEPKVIDFGVARSADASEQRTMQTQAGVLIGTPQYMSPEQVAADPSQIDTRSDVYSLGMVLYELLSGKLPYDIAHVSIHEAARVIREYPPTRLSAMTLGEIRGDVETIVMKALEKSPDRRYQSAASLAADVRRYLNNEPIAARPPSMTYQLRVLARRHKAIASGVMVGIFALMSATAISTVFARSENQQRQTAEKARDTAQQQFDRAQTVTTFLKEMLASADPRQAQGKELTVRELLDVAAARVPDALKTDPISAGNVQMTLGQTYYQLGEYPKAQQQFESAYAYWKDVLGPDDADTLNARALTGVTVLAQGKPADAEAIFREALDAQKRTIGTDDRDTLATIGNLALALQDQGKLDEAEKLQRESLAIKQRILGPGDNETLSTMMNLADLLESQGKMQEAVDQAEKAAQATEAALGPKHPSTLMARSIQCSALEAAGRAKEAEPLLRSIIQSRNEVLGPDHPDTLTSRNLLTQIIQAREAYDEAEPLLRENLALARKRLGVTHPTTLTYQNNLAMNLTKQAQKTGDQKSPLLDESETLLRQVIDIEKAAKGTNNVSVLSAMNNLALALENRGKYAEAEPIYREVVAGLDATMPADHFLRFASRKNLADCLVDLNRIDEAEPMLLQAYADLKRVLGEDHPRTRGAAKSLELLYSKTNKPDEAKKWAALSVAKPANNP